MVDPTQPGLGQGLHPCQGHCIAKSDVPHANCFLCCLMRLANHFLCCLRRLASHCHYCLRICPASNSCRRGQTDCVTPRFPVAHHHPLRCHVAATTTWLDHGIHNVCSLAPVKMAGAQSCTSLCCLCSIPLLIYCCCPAPCVCFCMWLYMVCTSCSA